MSLRPAASLALKLLALWLLIPLLDAFPTFVQLMSPSTATTFGAAATHTFLMAALVPFFLRATFGVFLWLFSDGLAASMVKDKGEATDSTSPTPLDWQRLAFSVLGTYFCVSAAEALSGISVKAFLLAQNELSMQTARVGAADVVPFVVRGALGLFLLLGARGVMRGVAGLRNIGREPENIE